MTVWVIRVWEEPVPEGEDPLAWLVLTSVPTTTLEEAWERVQWDTSRWGGEDDHHGLKSGCRIDHRQWPTGDGLVRLLGGVSPLAVRLVHLRAWAREDPERPARTGLDPLMLAVGAEHSPQTPETMTLATFWREVARLGGSLARSRDGPAGWRTIWKGWLLLQTLLEGVHLASHLRL